METLPGMWGKRCSGGSVQEYIEVENHHEADAVIVELERYLHQNNRENLTAEETGKLRAVYARLVARSTSW
ncbi:hypothetical protein [Methanogenium cariaci]|uniref:hypothetical protein n=1 Tax=Methanogenium cariaci TaxID=2197 RepID=UPI0007853555|nr:hypothetical protein [Methanogenium cariaci]